MADETKEINKKMRDAYLDEVGGGIWNSFFLSGEEHEEWDSIINDFRNGEDKATHRERVSNFKKRMDEKYSHKK